jgi:hypothetical protein
VDGKERKRAKAGGQAPVHLLAAITHGSGLVIGHRSGNPATDLRSRLSLRRWRCLGLRPYTQMELDDLILSAIL